MPPLLVAGDGNAWFRLAAQGLLEGRGPLRYIAESDDDALERALAAGAEAVVTDTNRRQVTLLTRFGEMGSFTLAPGDDVGREPGDLFQRAGSQSVAVFGDATKINSAGTAEGAKTSRRIPGRPMPLTATSPRPGGREPSRIRSGDRCR